MLVLSRKVGQEIMIGDSIRLVVVEVRRGQVRLAFSAPDDVPIHRREVYRQVAERETSGNLAPISERLTAAAVV